MGFKNKQNFQRLGWCCNFFFAILCLITFAFDLYYNIALSRPRMVGHHYANYTPNQILNQYMTQITPALWIFWVWVVLYGILIIWFIYVFYLLMCRQSCSRDNKTPLFSGFFWFLFILVNVLNAIWLHLFVHHHILISGITLVVLILILYVVTILAHRICWLDTNKKDENNTNDESSDLMECEIMVLKFLTLNALPLYAMWCTIIASLQWAIILNYFSFHFSDNVASVIALAFLSVLLLVHWGLELLFQRKYYVYTWLPTFALLIFFAAIIIKHGSIGSIHRPGLFFAFILLVVVGISFILKCCGLCCCYPKSPNPKFSRV